MIYVSCNAKKGGVYSIDDDRKIEKVFDHESRGLIHSKQNNCFYVAASVTPDWKSTSLYKTDEKFNVLKKIPVANEAHGLFLHENNIYLSENVENKITVFDLDLNLKKTMYYGDDRFKTFPDHHHLNDVFIHKGFMYACMHRYKFNIHARTDLEVEKINEFLKTNKDLPEEIVIEKKKRINEIKKLKEKYSFIKPSIYNSVVVKDDCDNFNRENWEIVISDLSQAHTPVIHEDKIYVCSSKDLQLKVYDFNTYELLVTKNLSGFTRGLFVDKDYVYVGICSSLLRTNKVSPNKNAKVSIFNRKDLSIKEKIELDCFETYSIVIVK